MIKGIFFDAAGVLYRRSSPTADFALALLKQNEYSTLVAQEQSDHLERMRVDASMGQTSHENYWHQFLQFHGVIDLEQRSEMIKKILEYSNSVLPVDGCRDALLELKRRGFILGIISDTIYPLEWKMKRLSMAGVADLIEIVACSTDLGMHKPHPAFYRYAVNQAELAPYQTAFVGHDIRELRGARRAGMMTVAIFAEEGSKADHYCNSMADLIMIPEFEEAAIVQERHSV